MAMKLELNIVEDAELRAFVREYIRNEVVGVAREEIKEAVAQAMGTKLKPENAQQLLMQVVREESRYVIGKLSVKAVATAVIEEAVKPVVTEVLTEDFIQKAVNTAAKSAAKDLLAFKLKG